MCGAPVFCLGLFSLAAFGIIGRCNVVVEVRWQGNTAVFLKDNQVVSIPNPVLFSEGMNRDVVDGIQLEFYPNRDSVKFVTHHAIPECQTHIRGTYRYPGWCRMMKAVTDLQLHSTAVMVPPIGGATYAAFCLQHVGILPRCFTWHSVSATYGLFSRDWSDVSRVRVQ